MKLTNTQLAELHAAVKDTLLSLGSSLTDSDCFKYTKAYTGDFWKKHPIS